MTQIPEAPKTQQQLVKDAVELASAAGRTCMGMGMRMAPITVDPKKVATALLEVGDQFEAMADAARKLASDVCDHDAANDSRIIVPKRGLS